MCFTLRFDMRDDTKFKTLFRLFTVFFKAGTFTFAGGLAMLPVIQRDVVDKFGFMTEAEFMEYATLSQTLPGVIALNCAVFVGRKTAGTIGAIAAGIGAVFSAFILMVLATALLQIIPQGTVINGAFRGIRAAAAALILSAAFSIGKHNLNNAFAVCLMLCAFAAIVFARISALYVIISAGAIGYVYCRVSNRGKGARE